LLLTLSSFASLSGSAITAHPGNKAFLTLLTAYKEDYFFATKREKGQLVRNIIKFIRSRGGRFLVCGEDKLWYECGDEAAAKKVSQRLREGNPKALFFEKATNN
jgi:hypothetical protein